MSRLVTEHLSAFDGFVSFRALAGGRGEAGSHRSIVSESLMQFSNATYSCHVSLKTLACEIAKARLGWGAGAQQRQGHAGAPDVGGRAQLITTHCSVGVCAPLVN